MTPEIILKQFYTEINEWIESGCPHHPTFYTSLGLCANLDNWLQTNCDSIKLKKEVNNCQTVLFNLTFGDSITPFNKSSSYAYVEEGNLDIMYKNPARLQWIKEHI